MGGEPPQQQEREQRDEHAVRARGHWVGQLLGEQWQTDGDGIYRLAAEEDPPEPAPSSTGSVERAAGRDAVDDLIAELTADLRRR
jgi:hypothetical protein